MEAADVGVLEKIGPPLGLVWELVRLSRPRVGLTLAVRLLIHV